MFRYPLKKKNINRLFLILTIPVLVFAGNYTVKKWDTIWDLSGKYLGDPYSWERIWQANRQVNDPHWIYPGDILNIPGAGDDYQGGQNSNNNSSESYNSDASASQPPVSTTGLKFTKPPISKELATIDSSSTFASDDYNQNRDKFASKGFTEELFRQVSFLWSKANNSGVVLPGNAYIYEKREIGTFREYENIECVIESGNNFSIGDTIEVIHPVKYQKLKGQVTNLVKKVALGTVAELFTAPSGQKMMKIKLYKLWDSVVNNDRVIKAESLPPMVVESLVAPEKRIEGNLFLKAEKTEISYVFQPFILDIGESEGVKLGDVYLIYKNSNSKIEKEPSAMGFIVHISGRSSTLMISNMRQIVDVGDRVSLYKRVSLK